MPVNTAGVRIGTAEYDRNDGFAPGSDVVLHIPGLDNSRALERTAAAGLLDMGKSLDRRQPIVIIDEATGARQLIWSELDANATSPQTTDLLIHPGKDFTDGHTYVVALRDLRTATGHLIAAPSWFALLRQPHAPAGGAFPSRPLQAHLHRARGRRDRPREPLRGVGLHHRLGEEPDLAPARDPQQRVRPAR